MSELKAKSITPGGTCNVYLKSDVDNVIAEKDKEIARLKEKCEMLNFYWDRCGLAKRGFKNTIAVSNAYDSLEAENKKLKAENEALKKELKYYHDGPISLTCKGIRV